MIPRVTLQVKEIDWIRKVNHRNPQAVNLMLGRETEEMIHPRVNKGEESKIHIRRK